jgi:hypothetical protein
MTNTHASPVFTGPHFYWVYLSRYSPDALIIMIAMPIGYDSIFLLYKLRIFTA